MKRDDIIRIARETGASFETADNMFRFVSLIAAAERDRMCEQFNIPKELAHEKAKSNETSRAKVLGES